MVGDPGSLALTILLPMVGAFLKAMKGVFGKVVDRSGDSLPMFKEGFLHSLGGD